MLKQEAKKIISTLLAAYPNYKPADVGAVIDTWASLLSEYPYRQVDAALRAYILTDTSGFAPSIGQIVDKIHTLTHSDGLTEMEAWALVRHAIGNGCYGAEEEYGKLPPAVRTAVGSPEQIHVWATDEDYNEAVVSSNFMRSFRMATERERELAKLPESVRMIAQNTGKALEG